MELLHCPSISTYTPKLCFQNHPFSRRNYAGFENKWRKSRSSVMMDAAADSGRGGAAAKTTATVVVVEKLTTERRRFEVLSGKPLPFGATARDGGVNFAVFSRNATSATLCLITLSDLPEKRVTEQIFLDPLVNKTGDVWHVFLKGDFENMLYGYNFDGKFCPEGGHYFDSSQIVLDPYAKATVSRGEYGVLGPEDDCWPPMAGMVPSAPDQFIGKEIYR